MKTTLLILFLAITASAQTNKPTKPAATRAVAVAPKPGSVELSNTLAQITVIQKQIATLSQNSRVIQQRIELQREAGKISNRAYHELSQQERKKLEVATAPLNKRIASLRLTEFEIRQRYKLPATSTKRR